MTKYFRLRETLANNLQSKQWQICNTSVLHLGWSRMCFTALVRLIDSHVLRRVLCFFLLPGWSGAWQTSQLQARSGRHHDNCKMSQMVVWRHLHAQWVRLSNQMTPIPMVAVSIRFQCPTWINLVHSLKFCFATTVVQPVNTREPLLAPSTLSGKQRRQKPLPLKQFRALSGCKLQYIRRKFRSQTSDNMARWKAEMGRVREEKKRRKKIKKRKSQKKEDPGARKGKKVAKTLCSSNDLLLQRVQK